MISAIHVGLFTVQNNRNESRLIDQNEANLTPWTRPSFTGSMLVDVNQEEKAERILLLAEGD